MKKPTEIAVAFNNHSATIGPISVSKIRSKAADDNLQQLPADVSSTVLPFVLKRVEKHLLKREINGLKCSKSPGHDRIPVKVIKDAVQILTKRLATIFNSSMDKGVFAEIWKLAMITPIYK